MSNFRLEIINQSFEVDVPDVKINYQIKDFTEVDSRKSDFSYSFDLNLNTSESFSDFLHLYCNLDFVINSEFNPFSRFIPFDSDKFSFFQENPCKLYYKGVLIFNGRLEILEGEIYDRKLHKLKCRLTFGRNTWVTAASDLDIHDVDLGEYCFNLAHVQSGLLDITNVAKNTPYAFPLMEYGALLYETATQGGQAYLTTNIEFMYPTVFVRNLLHTGFQQLGYTLEFPLLDTDEWKGLCIPTSREDISNIIDLDLAKMTVTSQTTPSSIPYSTLGTVELYNEDFSVVESNCDPATDAVFITIPDSTGNNYPVGYAMGDCICKDGAEICIDFSAAINLDLGPTVVGFTATYELIVGLYKADGLGNSLLIWNDSVFITVANGTPAGNYTFNFYLPELCFPLAKGESVFMQTRWNADPTPVIRTVSNVSVQNVEFNVNSTDEFREGYVYELARVLPDGSFFDYVRDLMTMFNLIPIEKEGKIIELVPYNDYFPTIFNSSINNKLVDWNDKVDIKGYKIKHSAIDLGRYVDFTWSEGEDYLNTQYQELNPDDVFGSYQYDTGYLPSTKDSEITTDAVPTQEYNLIMKGGGVYFYPYFSDIDPDIIYLSLSPYEERVENINISKRYLMYRGLSPVSFTIEYDNYDTGSTSQFLSNFYGLVQFSNDLLWSNLYDKFHKRELNHLTKGRIVTLQVTIDQQFIENLQFCNLIYWNNNYFIVNKVQGFNPNSEKLTKIELLQIS